MGLESFLSDEKVEETKQEAPKPQIIENKSQEIIQQPISPQPPKKKHWTESLSSEKLQQYLKDHPFCDKTVIENELKKRGVEIVKEESIIGPIFEGGENLIPIEQKQTIQAQQALKKDFKPRDKTVIQRFIQGEKGEYHWKYIQKIYEDYKDKDMKGNPYWDWLMEQMKDEGIDLQVFIKSKTIILKQINAHYTKSWNKQ